MENIIYNELRHRGFGVDVGSFEYNYKDESGVSKRKDLEIDFVCHKANNIIYIQSAYEISSEVKLEQEIRGLKLLKDSFRKIVIVKDNIIPRKDEYGILYVGIDDFLRDDRYTLDF